MCIEACFSYLTHLWGTDNNKCDTALRSLGAFDTEGTLNYK